MMAKAKSYKGDYQRYVEWYHRQERIAERQGHTMFSQMYSEKRFQDTYAYTKRDLEELVKEGKRGSVGNVYQYMTREQTYLMDYSTQMALKREFPELKPHRFETVEDVTKRFTKENWDKLDNLYWQSRHDGLSGRASAAIVSQVFFGSY